MTFGSHLQEAGIGKFVPLKHVDKLEKKLLKKMNVNANKAEKYKRRMANDSHRNKKTQNVIKQILRSIPPRIIAIQDPIWALGQ